MKTALIIREDSDTNADWIKAARPGARDEELAISKEAWRRLRGKLAANAGTPCGESFISSDKVCRIGLTMTVEQAEKMEADAKDAFRAVAQQEEMVTDWDKNSDAYKAAYEKVSDARRIIRDAKLHRDHPKAVPIDREELDAILKPLQDLRGNDDVKVESQYFKGVFREIPPYKRGEKIGESQEMGPMYKAVPNRSTILFRGVTRDDWDRMQDQGYLDTDMRGAISRDEGMNMTHSTGTAAYYLPDGDEGVVLAIETKDANVFKIEPDEYLRTHDKIPIEKVVKVSRVLGKHPDAGMYKYPGADDVVMPNSQGKPCGDSWIDADKTCRIGGFELAAKETLSRMRAENKDGQLTVTSPEDPKWRAIIAFGGAPLQKAANFLAGKLRITEARDVPQWAQDLKQGGYHVGSCYDQAGKFMLNAVLLPDDKVEQLRLVHGAIGNKETTAMLGHGWVEIGEGIVFDGVMQKFYNKEAYYRELQAVPEQTYTRQEAFDKMKKIRMYGPWGPTLGVTSVSKKRGKR